MSARESATPCRHGRPEDLCCLCGAGPEPVYAPLCLDADCVQYRLVSVDGSWGHDLPGFIGYRAEVRDIEGPNAAILAAVQARLAREGKDACVWKTASAAIDGLVDIVRTERTRREMTATDGPSRGT